MIVAIGSAKWADVDSLETLLGFDEFEYLALFLWLAIAGAGAVSVDHYLEGWFSAARPRRRRTACTEPAASGCRHAVEEIHHAGVDRVLRAHHQQAVLADELLEHLGAVPQVIGRHADVGAHGAMLQVRGIA